MYGMCCRSSYGEGEFASGAKPSANMGKKKVMDSYLMPNRLSFSVVYKTGLLVCFSAAVDHLDSAGDRDRGLQEVHGVRGARERAVVHSGTEYGQIQVMMQQRSPKCFLHWHYARLI